MAVDLATVGLMPVVLASCAALAGLARGFRSLKGTTLRAPWWWTLTAVVALVAAEFVAERFTSADQLRYLAAVATFCPLMAVLGAKRPQDRGWQFIVVSLWVVLAMPALQSWFTRLHAELDLHTAWRWFLLILIAVGLLNTLPTRHWPSSVLAAVGQIGLLAEHLPFVIGPSVDEQVSNRLGAVLWCSAVGLWGWRLPASRMAEQALDRLWLDFRDLVGTMWAVRVLERINAACGTSGWKARLTWQGWVLDGQLPAAFYRSLHMLLRRFVSPEWIAKRMPPFDR